MAEYIEREALLSWAREFYPNDKQFASAVMNALVADVVEVRHGYWKEIQGEVGNPFNNQVFDTIDLLVCSVCNETFDVSEARNYCPNCGAKMDGKGESNG